MGEIKDWRDYQAGIRTPVMGNHSTDSLIKYVLKASLFFSSCVDFQAKS